MMCWGVDFSQWTPTERALAEAVLAGKTLDVSAGLEAARTVRAEIIRELLLGRRPQDLTAGLPDAPDPQGLRLHGAIISGRINLDYLRATIRLQLTDTSVSHGITANFVSIPSIQLAGCTLGSMANQPVLDATQAKIDHDLGLRTVTAANDSPQGTIRLTGARIGGHLDLTGANISNSDGPAIAADFLTLDGSALMTLAAVGTGERGAIRLLGARVGGQVQMSRANLTNVSGPALAADNLTVGTGVDMSSMTATGEGERGVVRLPNALIGSQLNMDSASLSNQTGPAMFADGLAVANDLFLRSLTASGHGEQGTIRLPGAHVSGELNMNGARLSNQQGPALKADGLVVDGNAYMNLAGGEGGAIRLSGAHIGGYLNADFEAVTSSSAWLVIYGLTYRGVPKGGVDSWLRLLREATPQYTAQPYRQLAAATSASGHDADTRKVLIAQRRDQLKRASVGARDRRWGHITWWTLGYGYQPWRALLWLIGVVVVSAILSVVVGAYGLYPKGHETDRSRCSVAERVILGVDNALPLVTTSVSSTCLTRTAPNKSGQALVGLGVGAQIAGWAFATLFVAGFTAAVRKT